MTDSHAQPSLAQMRQDLIAPWLMTVQGEDRTRILRISEVVQDTEGSYLLTARIGWTDGVQGGLVPIELIQSGMERRLVFRLNVTDLISVRQSGDGEFTGNYRTSRGAEKAVKLEKVSEEELPQVVKVMLAKLAARVFADEDKDWGVPPRKQPRTDRYHAPTPKDLPGATTIRTTQLRAMRSQTPAPILIDVLGGDGHRTIRGSHWLRGAGLAAGAEVDRLRFDLEKLTAGRKAAPLVFFCLNSECWLSYNAGLRAIELGYTNVHWFRGGTVAWQSAQFEMMEAEPYRRDGN